MEVARALGPLTGRTGPRTLSVGWNPGSDLGFAFPLVIPDLGQANSVPIVATGLNAYMLRLTVTAGPGGTINPTLNPLNPDLTPWFATGVGFIGAGNAIPGTELLPSAFTSQFEFCSFLCRLELSVVTGGAGGVTLSAVDLWSWARP